MQLSEKVMDTYDTIYIQLNLLQLGITTIQIMVSHIFIIRNIKDSNLTNIFNLLWIAKPYPGRSQNQPPGQAHPFEERSCNPFNEREGKE